MKGLIGVLGGMGPAATADLFNKFISFTKANCDQEHIPLIISSIPNIPDRTQALLHDGRSPLPLMQSYLHLLENAGAECIVIPCNTAHYWFSELKESCHVEMLSIIDTTMQEVIKTGKKQIGLLATNATVHMGLYQKRMEDAGLNCLIPNKDEQQKVMESIYLLKSGEVERSEKLMKEIAQSLFDKNVQVIVLGCTEVPVILQKEIKNNPDKYIDSTSSLVNAGINWYQKRQSKII